VLRAEVLALEKDIGDAVSRADFEVLEASCAEDLRFTHANGLTESKAEWLEAMRASPRRQYILTSSEVEAHGDVAVSVGRLDAVFADGREIAVQYVRVYGRRDGRWQLLSHRSGQRIGS
jgi:hypothetical protein